MFHRRRGRLDILNFHANIFQRREDLADVGDHGDGGTDGDAEEGAGSPAPGGGDHHDGDDRGLYRQDYRRINAVDEVGPVHRVVAFLNVAVVGGFHMAFGVKQADHPQTFEGFGHVVVDVGDGPPVVQLGGAGAPLAPPREQKEQRGDGEDQQPESFGAGEDDRENRGEFKAVGDHRDHAVAVEHVDGVAVVGKNRGGHAARVGVEIIGGQAGELREERGADAVGHFLAEDGDRGVLKGFAEVRDDDAGEIEQCQRKGNGLVRGEAVDHPLEHQRRDQRRHDGRGDSGAHPDGETLIAAQDTA